MVVTLNQSDFEFEILKYDVICESGRCDSDTNVLQMSWMPLKIAESRIKQKSGRCAKWALWKDQRWNFRRSFDHICCLIFVWLEISGSKWSSGSSLKCNHQCSLKPIKLKYIDILNIEHSLYSSCRDHSDKDALSQMSGLHLDFDIYSCAIKQIPNKDNSWWANPSNSWQGCTFDKSPEWLRVK